MSSGGDTFEAATAQKPSFLDALSGGSVRFGRARLSDYDKETHHSRSSNSKERSRRRDDGKTLSVSDPTLTAKGQKEAKKEEEARLKKEEAAANRPDYLKLREVTGEPDESIGTRIWDNTRYIAGTALTYGLPIALLFTPLNFLGCVGAIAAEAFMPKITERVTNNVNPANLHWTVQYFWKRTRLMEAVKDGFSGNDNALGDDLSRIIDGDTLAAAEKVPFLGGRFKSLKANSMKKLGGLRRNTLVAHMALAASKAKKGESSGVTALRMGWAAVGFFFQYSIWRGIDTVLRVLGNIRFIGFFFKGLRMLMNFMPFFKTGADIANVVRSR